MACFLVRLNNLPSIWYTKLMIIIQAYLLYLAFERYKLYTEIKWPNNVYPTLSLTIYISLCGACIPILFLFYIFGVFKTGNLAGDNKKLDSKDKHFLHQVRERSSCLCRLFKSTWRHSPPIAQLLHVIAALCQLVAQQIMIAQLYRSGFINSGDFLNTELDFIFQRSRQLATNLPMGDTRLQGFRITTEELTNSPLAPNLLPILMHARLFGIPLEFVNLVVALIAYTSVYPAVFWKLSKSFSLIFTFHLVTHSVNVVFSYLSFSILYRIQETNFQSVRPVGLSQYLAATSQLVVYHPLIVLGTFVATFFCMHLTPMIMYAYGYSKFIDNLRYVTQRRPANPPPNVGLLDDYEGRPTGATSSVCCYGYVPHMCAVILLMLIVTIKSPVIYYFLLLLNNEHDKPFLLTCFAVDAFYLLSWLCLWCFLAIKHEWDFFLTVPGSTYKPNMTGIVNPGPPRSIFDNYPREDKTATVYQPGSYASIRRPVRNGLVFAQGTEVNDYTSFDAYNKMSTLRNSPNAYRETKTVTYSAQTYSPKQKPAVFAQSNGQKPQLINTNITRPLIVGTHDQKPVLWGLQSSRPVMNGGSDNHMRMPMMTAMTPSSTITSHASSFNQDQNIVANETATLLNINGSTNTLTNIGNSSFATSVV
ncbi:hypothetical protein M3Y97_00836400 [Aphelenchoides bicaudatus]|nr:hypothetical protein M3Y97_00836400 [Aphelenchoides bicaudatus]